MTDHSATEGAAAPAEPAQESGRRRWLLISGIVALVLVIAGGAWAVVATQVSAFK